MAVDPKAAESGADEGKRPTIEINLTMDKRIELAISVVIVLLGLFIVTQARTFKIGLVQDPLTPRGLPMMLGAFLMLGGMIAGAMRLASWSALPGHYVPAEGRQDEEGHPVSAVRPLAIAAAGILWVLLLDTLGYLIITPLYLVPILLFLKIRSWKMLIGFSLIYTVASWVIF